jgi:hypothetical protein
MSERFKPFGKPVGSAAGCKAFNDAVSANESQAAKKHSRSLK